MENRVRRIFLVVCGLALASSVVYAELKKGYYSPAELGSLRQAAPIVANRPRPVFRYATGC